MILDISGEFLLKLRTIRIDIQCQSFKDILGHLEFQVTKPNTIKISYKNEGIHTLIFNDLKFDVESISNFTKSDKKISFTLKCDLLNEENIKMNCKCSQVLGNKLKSSFIVSCSFCSSAIAITENIKGIKSEICENNQLEEVFYCHSHGQTEKLTEVVLEPKECVIHGLEFSVNKVLLKNENVNVEKNIISCIRCQKVVGRLDSMSNNQLKLYSTELLARIPKYDIDGDVVDHDNIPLCSTETEITHLVLRNIIKNEATKIMLISISDTKLTNIALLWNFQQIFSIYGAKIDLGKNESMEKLVKENRYRLLCLPNTSGSFEDQLESWNHDMSVYHMMAPDAVCTSFIDSLMKSRSCSEATDGFIPCSISLSGC